MMHAVVGKSVDGWCARCKLMLAHTIEAVVKGKITRTHCNTCGAQHAYRPQPPGSGRAKTRSSSMAGRPAGKVAPHADYQTLLRGKDVGKARAYKTSEHFQPQEIIHHPLFGIGVVLAVRDANKIDVGFPDGLKTLAQGR
jgi:hypothetical protein